MILKLLCFFCVLKCDIVYKPLRFVTGGVSTALCFALFQTQQNVMCIHERKKYVAIVRLIDFIASVLMRIVF